MAAAPADPPGSPPPFDSADPGDLPGAAAPPGEVDDALRAVVLNSVRQLSLWMALLFAIFVPLDLFFTDPPAAGRSAALLDAAAALAMALLHLALRCGVRVRWANAAAACLALALLPYVLLNVWLNAMPVLLAGLALWQIGICLVFLSWRWTASLLALSMLLAGIVVVHGLAVGRLPPSPDWEQYGFVLATSTVIGLVAHGVRLRTYRRLESLRIEERVRRLELEAAHARGRELETMRRVNRAKTDFINTAAHELATPLTPVLLQAHILRNELQDAPPAQRRSIELMVRNLQRLHALLKDVLDSARIQADHLPMAQNDVELAEVLAEALLQYRSSAAAKDVTVELEGADEMAVVQADAKRLRQVIDNLLSNALKFTPKGGHVSVRRTSRDGLARVEVTDTGVGIPPGQAGRLFVPFVQLHSDLQVGGTGLGLYICKGIVEHYGGTMGCESAGTGRGATFWFQLPLRGAPAAQEGVRVASD